MSHKCHLKPRDVRHILGVYWFTVQLPQTRWTDLFDIALCEVKTEDETLGLGICCRHFTGDGTRSCVHTTVIEFICTVQQREGLKVFQFLLSIYSTNFSKYVCPKHHFEHRCPRCVVCLLSCVEIKPFRGWIMFYFHCLWIVTKLRVYVASWILSFLPSPHFQTLMFNTSSVQCQPPK